MRRDEMVEVAVETVAVVERQPKRPRPKMKEKTHVVVVAAAVAAVEEKSESYY